MLLAPAGLTGSRTDEERTTMADIRLISRGPRIWLWTGIFAAVGLALWASAFLVGDLTAPEELPRVGAGLDLGERRAPVLPPQAVPFQSLSPLEPRDLGRLVHLTGVAETPARSNAIWVRSTGGRRILVRFEPDPQPEALRRFSPGASVEFDGYLEKISRAEFDGWMDSLSVRIPRPPPARKFGDLPDPGFARVDSLFVRTYYISVRPAALGTESAPTTAPAEPPAAARPRASEARGETP